jgi:AcrR family transcriptional regulator
MAGNSSGEKTKEKILEAAQQVFVEKGFASARMEDVAKRSSITKTMLYYHFDTKRNLLHEIAQRTVNELKLAFSESLSEHGSQSPEEFRKHLGNIMSFFERHRSIVRLIVAEYISNPDETLPGFADMFEVIRGFAGKDEPEFLVRLFFFNAIPMLMYTCIGEKFCSEYGVEREMSDRVFADTFARTFLESAE